MMEPSISSVIIENDNVSNDVPVSYRMKVKKSRQSNGFIRSSSFVSPEVSEPTNIPRNSEYLKSLNDESEQDNNDLVSLETLSFEAQKAHSKLSQSEIYNNSDQSKPPQPTGLGRFSFFKSISTQPATIPETAEDESQFVISRLEESNSDAFSTTKWFSESLSSAFQAIKDSVIGEEHDPEKIDWDFWGRMVNDYENTIRKQYRYYLIQLHKGIPGSLRGIMWQKMCKRSDRYANLYKSLLSRSSNDEKIILRDLARTYPSHAHFKDSDGPGQTSLFNILKAYSVFDPEIGYCQGIAFVVGPLILNMPDEDAFSVFVTLMKEYGFRELYSPKLIGLQMRLYQFEKLLEDRFPQISKHLINLDVKPNMYASQWFMTLFAYRFPLEMVFRIMDIVFAEGYESVLRFSLALIQKNYNAILELDEFESILDLLQNGLFDPYIGDIDSLIQDAYQIKFSKQRLEKLAAEHAEITRLSSPDFIDAGILRAENFKAMEKIKQLEFSYEILNREHVEMANETLQLKIELENANMHVEELQATVDALKAVLSHDRNAAEKGIRTEIDILSQRNEDLVSHNIYLQKDILYLQNQLAEIKKSNL